MASMEELAELIAHDINQLEARTADTDWRDVSADLMSGATGTLHIRRVGMTVHWRVKDFVSGTGHAFYLPPAGMRVTADVHIYPAAGKATDGFYLHRNGHLARSMYEDPIAPGFWWQGLYVLPAGTPPITILPGTPA